MDKFDFGNYSSSIEEYVFNPNKGYVNASGETDARKQLSTPLEELKSFINDTIPVNTSNKAVQLVVDSGYVKYRTTSGATPTAIKTEQSDWNSNDNTSNAFIKNKPTIPTVNNATLTIQKNSATVSTFTANASSNVTANIKVPQVWSAKTSASSTGTFTASSTSQDFALETGAIIALELANAPTGTNQYLVLDSNDSKQISKKSGTLDPVTASDLSQYSVIILYYDDTYFVLVGGVGGVTVDSAMSSYSSNPVKNSVIKAYVDQNFGSVSTTISAGNTSCYMNFRNTKICPAINVEVRYWAEGSMGGYELKRLREGTDYTVTCTSSTAYKMETEATSFDLYVTLNSALSTTAYVVFSGNVLQNGM